MWEERPSGHSLIPSQEASLQDPCSSTAGTAPYGITPQLKVRLLDEDLVHNPAMRMGAPVTLIGVLKATPSELSGGHQAKAWTAEMLVNNILPALPPLKLTPALTAMPAMGATGSPLNDLSLSLIDSTGCLMGPPTALALLCSGGYAGYAIRQLQRQPHISPGGAPLGPIPAASGCPAASGISASSAAAALGGIIPPVNIMIRHDTMDPLVPRTLKSCASLLSTHSMAPAGPAQAADLFTCKVEKQAGCVDALTAEGAVQCTASLLAQSNSGWLCYPFPICGNPIITSHLKLMF